MQDSSSARNSTSAQYRSIVRHTRRLFGFCPSHLPGWKYPTLDKVALPGNIRITRLVPTLDHLSASTHIFSLSGEPRPMRATFQSSLLTISNDRICGANAQNKQRKKKSISHNQPGTQSFSSLYYINYKIIKTRLKPKNI